MLCPPMIIGRRRMLIFSSSTSSTPTFIPVIESVFVFVVFGEFRRRRPRFFRSSLCDFMSSCWDPAKNWFSLLKWCSRGQQQEQEQVALLFDFLLWKRLSMLDISSFAHAFLVVATLPPPGSSSRRPCCPTWSLPLQRWWKHHSERVMIMTSW